MSRKMKPKPMHIFAQGIQVHDMPGGGQGPPFMGACLPAGQSLVQASENDPVLLHCGASQRCYSRMVYAVWKSDGRVQFLNFLWEHTLAPVWKVCSVLCFMITRGVFFRIG